MSDLRPAIVDVRGAKPPPIGRIPDLPLLSALPVGEPTPRLLVDEPFTIDNRATTATITGGRSPRGHGSSPPAGRRRLPRPARRLLACSLLGLLALLVLEHRSHSASSLASHSGVAGAQPMAIAPAAAPAFGATLPALGTGNIPVPPVRLVIEIPAGLAGKLHPELPALRRWLSANEQSTSTIRILLRGPSRTITPPVTVASIPPLGRGRPTTIRGAVRWLLAPARPRPVRALIGIQLPAAPAALPTVHIGTVGLLGTASAPTATSADPNTSNSIAAAIALQVADATGQSVQQRPQLTKSQ